MEIYKIRKITNELVKLEMNITIKKKSVHTPQNSEETDFQSKNLYQKFMSRSR